MCSRLTIFTLALAAISAGCAGTGPTDREPIPIRLALFSDTGTTRSGELEAELGLTIDPGEASALPLALKWGLDASSEMFVTGSPHSTVERAGPDGRGVGDFELGYRNRVLDQTGRSPALALELRGKLPTADVDQGLGSGEPDFFAAGIVERTFPTCAVLGSYELGVLGDPAGGVLLEHSLSAAGSLAFAPGAAVFGELGAHFVPEQGTDERSGTLGVSFALTENVAIDLGLVVGLGGDAGDVRVVAGLTRVFGLFSAR